MNDRTRTIYEFGGFRLDPARRVLSSADGEPIALKPKVFDTLLFFVERPLELVTKDALMQGVWPDASSRRNNLSQNISVLRRVLGEKAGEHRFIVTEPRRGYRFVAAVDQVAANAGANGHSDVPLGAVAAETANGLAAGPATGLAPGPSPTVSPHRRWPFSALRVPFRPAQPCRRAAGP